ncbi:unnamed protein product [Echinostoma caproni]|uniref:Uncharacterized protein n=1 Tax=Echinostoma caproni TaxID=27848 RepID=A0A183B9K6_9TREM|nr:unnamed protein product [Echinostoma caproni]
MDTVCLKPTTTVSSPLEVENDEDNGVWESCSGDEDSGEEEDWDDEKIEEEDQRNDKDDKSTTNSRQTDVKQSKITTDLDDGWWIDVPHSSDDELVEKEKRVDPVELKLKAREIASSRVFTQEEF